MRRITTSLIGLGSVAALVLTGCSNKASGGGDSGGGDGGLQTDFGVTEDTITLGLLTDLSGVFKLGGLGQTQGNEMWVKDINEAGGICDREIVLDVQDHGYLPDKALPLYDGQKDKVVGIMQLLGSPILAALKQRLTNDKVLAIPGSWASASLDSPSVFMLSATYDIEAINGLAYFQQEGMIADGDKIGVIYIDSEYGQNSLLGVQHYAQEHDLELVESAISASDSDMTATITKMKAEGITALFLATTPAAGGSAALQVMAQGLNIPVIGNNPTWTPPMLNDPQLVEAAKNYWIVSTIDTFANEDPFIQELLTEYQANYTEKPYDAVLLGYAQGLTWQAVLEQACEDGDMTRDGIFAAKGKITDFDAKGLLNTHDFSLEGEPLTREVFIVKPDPAGVSGNLPLEENYTSEEAKSYKAPFQK